VEDEPVFDPPYRKVKPHPFLVANHLVRGSYVSLHPLASFAYHHVRPALLTGYRLERLGDGQEALVATPAKALADLVGLVPGADSPPMRAAKASSAAVRSAPFVSVAQPFSGTRVPLNSQAPLTLSGCRSTTGHWLQSSMRQG
jgi:hypothetical protein